MKEYNFFFLILFCILKMPTKRKQKRSVRPKRKPGNQNLGSAPAASKKIIDTLAYGGKRNLVKMQIR